jgi:hypothetical protein
VVGRLTGYDVVSILASDKVAPDSGLKVNGPDGRGILSLCHARLAHFVITE